MTIRERITAIWQNTEPATDAQLVAGACQPVAPMRHAIQHGTGGRTFGRNDADAVRSDGMRHYVERKFLGH